MNGVPVRFNNMFADRQAQTAAGNVTASSFLRAVETFKYSSQVFFWNAYSIVAYLNQYIFPICVISAGYNMTVVLALFYGIIN